GQHEIPETGKPGHSPAARAEHPNLRHAERRSSHELSGAPKEGTLDVEHLGRRVRADASARGSGAPFGPGGRHVFATLDFVLALGEPRDRGDLLAFLEADETHALRVATDHAYVVGAQPDHLTAAGHEHDLVLVGDHADADDATGLLRRAHRDDAFSAAPRQTVLFHLRPLAVAVGGDGEQRCARLREIEPDDLVTLVEPHAPHAVCAASHPPDVGLLEANRLAVARREDRLARAVGQAHTDDLVGLLE